MRIAVVCGHFAPEIGYQEVGLARAFARSGAHVRVVTSTALSPNARTLLRGDYPPGLQEMDGYEIVRLQPRFSVGPNVLGCNVKPSVEAFRPDFVVLVGPGKLFGIELISPKPRPWRNIAVLQDNSEDGRSRRDGPGRRSRAMAHRVVKRPVYRRVIRHADRIILNVPETRQLIEPWLNSRDRDLLLQKAVELRLGFDPEHFFFDRDERRRWRSEHGIADDEVLLATCTRALPSKNLEEVIDTVSVLRTGGMRLRYALAGLLEDGYAKHLRAHARSQPDPDALLLLPALKRDEMRELFCASDLGFWPRAAITIQQGMGTGLPIVLRRAPSVSHLLVPGRNGWYVAIGETLEHALARAIESLSAPTVAEGLARRRQVADLSRSYLSYDVLASAMINGL